MITLYKSKAQEEAQKNTLMDIIGFDIHIGYNSYLTVYIVTEEPIEQVCEEIKEYVIALKTYLFTEGYAYNFLKGIYYVNKYV